MGCFLMKMMRACFRKLEDPEGPEGEPEVLGHRGPGVGYQGGPAGPAGPGGEKPWRCDSPNPCPCCYYNWSKEGWGGPEQNFSTGWRNMNGDVQWWHGNAPHNGVEFMKQKKWWRVLLRWLRILPPIVPACPCCYYSYSHGWPPGCGWRVGHWAPDCRSYTWEWLHHQAPHAMYFVVPKHMIVGTASESLLDWEVPAEGVPWEEYKEKMAQQWRDDRAN